MELYKAKTLGGECYLQGGRGHPELKALEESSRYKKNVQTFPLSSRKQKTSRPHSETFTSQVWGETQESASPFLSGSCWDQI